MEKSGAVVQVNRQRPVARGGRIIFVGASTGGTEAVKTFLLGVPGDCPAILVVQHMPESFTASFAARTWSRQATVMRWLPAGSTLHRGIRI